MQNNSKKILSACTVASLLITSSVASVNVKAAAVTTPESTRLWGADRYETAVKVSQSAWTNSDYAVIASGEGFADALCATPLAKLNNAPILLTSKNSLDSKTLEELKRLKVKHVYIIGGQGVVSTAIENKIKSEMNLNTERIWGQNRYETSVKIAEKLGAQSKVFLASGEGYADALSAAPVAAIEGVPILLTESKTLSKETANYIKANTNITKTFVIGGYASVSDSTMSVVPGAQRFSGADRYETNAAVINGFSSDFDFKNVYMALGDGPNGNEFADAITGSAVAAKNKNPLIITSREYNATTEKLVKSKLLASSTVAVLGGEANLSNKLVEKIKETMSSKPAEGTTTGGGGGGYVSDAIETKINKIVALLNLSDSVKSNAKIGTMYNKSMDITINSPSETLSSNYSTFVNNPNLDSNIIRLEAILADHTITIGNESLLDYLKNPSHGYIYEKYTDHNGNILKGVVEDKLKSKDFAGIIGGVSTSVGSKVIPNIQIDTYTVAKITTADNVDIYNASNNNNTVNAIINNLLGTSGLNSKKYGDFKGSYKIYFKGMESAPYIINVK